MAVGAYPIAVNPVTGALTYPDGVESNEALPSGSGFITWTQAPRTCPGTTAPATGQVYLCKVQLREAVTISNVWICVTGAGTVTTGQCFLGFYSQDGTRRAVTADISASIAAAGTTGFALTSPYTPAAAGWGWVGVLIVGASPPTLLRGTGSSSTAPNAGLTAASFNWARSSSGQTSLPSSITPASNTAVSAGETFWVALS